MLEICLKSGKDRERMRKNEVINKAINEVINERKNEYKGYKYLC
ncbi:TPA: hypothetical protein R1615_001756 [Campylobacter jejuni]